MSGHSDMTIRYYEEHGERFVEETIGLSMDALYARFLPLLPKGAHILDIGCGSGRDTKAFLQRGFRVSAVDPSPKMVAAATRLTGQPAQLGRFQDLSFRDEFDGIWASASLLHVPHGELNRVFDRLVQASKPGGIMYVSFKEGSGERLEKGRHFTDFTENGLSSFFDCRSDLELTELWLSDDLRADRSERWVNGLIRVIKSRCRVRQVKA